MGDGPIDTLSIQEMVEHRRKTIMEMPEDEFLKYIADGLEKDFKAYLATLKDTYDLLITHTTAQATLEKLRSMAQNMASLTFVFDEPQ